MKLHTLLPYLLKVGLLCAIYFASARVGLQLGAVSGFATLVWPPTGIALAALVLFGYRLWPGIALGAFLVNVVTGAPHIVAIAMGIGNTLEAVVGTYWLRRFGFDAAMERVKDALLFIFFGALLNSVISATIGVTSLWVAGVVDNGAYATTWLAWWLGDVLGTIVVGNTIINVVKGFKRSKLTFKTSEAVALFSLIIIFNLVIFVGIFNTGILTRANASLIYLIFPLLIWAGLRFGTTGAAIAIFITSFMSVWGTTIGAGPFAAQTLTGGLFLLQLFIGAVAGTVIVLASAITERVRANQELLHEKKKDESILKSIGDGVVAVDTAGNIMLINKAAEEMLGLDTSSVIGRHFEDIVPSQDASGSIVPAKERFVYKTLVSGRVIADTGTYYYARSDGTRFPVAVTVAPIILDNRVVGAINVLRDVTREKEIDQAKSEFVSLASHQLRTPLTALKWYAEMLMSNEAGTLNAVQENYIKEMYRSNQRIIDLVNALLNVSRLELGTFSLSPKSVDIRKIINEVLELLLPQLTAKKIRLEQEIDAKITAMNADANALRIIFQNLISNSVKYSPSNTVVKVKVVKDGNTVRLSVADQGYGIPKAQQSKIFTKLFRADNAKTVEPEGNGLGLFIVKSVVEAGGGKVWFESVEGQGTTFFIEFPLSGMTKKKKDIQV